MSLLDPIVNYCERTGPELLAEPLNALSNASFFIAAWLLWRVYKRTPPPVGGRSGGGQHHLRQSRTAPITLPLWGREISILILFVILVGTGSALFHTFANRLTMIGDVVPIAMFTFYYLWVALRRLMGFNRKITALCLLVFALVASQMKHIPAEYNFNGSVAYFPCLAALLLVGFYLHRKQHVASRFILQAALLFVISLTFRSIDYAVCAGLPIGTHFLWHVLNGAVLYLLTRAVMRVE